MVTPRTLSGFMELLPPAQQQMEQIMEVLRRTYSLCGFTPLDTPLLEESGILLAKAGGETEKQVYRFQKGDSDLCLRFDLTVPLAKYAALYQHQLSFPFRRYQIGKVYRGERAQRGRFREFYQADIDILGDGGLSLVNEAEIPAVICRTFTALGLKHFHIRISNRKLLGGFFALLGLEGQSAALMGLVDKAEKVGPEKLREMMQPLADEGQIRALLSFLSLEGDNGEILAALEAYRGQNELFDQGLSELAAVVGYLPAFGVPDRHLRIDLSIARGLDYYTGTVYETTLPDYPEIGSVCSGGRYDDLAGFYTQRRLPGVGMSIGLTRLFYILGEQGLLNPGLPTAPADVLVLPMTDDLAPALSLTAQLRNAAIRTQVYCEDKKFKARLSYANKLGIPYVLFLGEDELKEGTVTCRDMSTGAQQRLSPADAVAHIRAGLARRNQGPILLEQKRNV